jgi:hypothetical protein
MRPDPPFVMRAALKSLEEIAAGQTDAGEISRLRGVMSLLAIVQGEWDTCASRRVAGIAHYSQVVREGVRLLGGERGDHLRQVLLAVEGAASDLRISSLEKRLDQLRMAVIDLQTWLEDTEGPGTRELLSAIWRAEYEDAKSEDRNRSFW